MLSGFRNCFQKNGTRRAVKKLLVLIYGYLQNLLPIFSKNLWKIRNRTHYALFISFFQNVGHRPRHQCAPAGFFFFFIAVLLFSLQWKRWCDVWCFLFFSFFLVLCECRASTSPREHMHLSSPTHAFIIASRAHSFMKSNTCIYQVEHIHLTSTATFISETVYDERIHLPSLTHSFT